MNVTQVEVLVEERSMSEVLRRLLPGLLGSIPWEVHEHRSKDDLVKRLPDRLRGYRAWLPADARIVVIVDRDDEDCAALKHRLEEIASKAGFGTRAKPKEGEFSVINRIAVEELEAWYFGDWTAVTKAYPGVDPNVPAKAKYRSPDAIRGGTWEAFERVLQGAGYFKTGLRKVQAAQAVALHMDPARNTSPSFRSLRAALLEMRAP